MKPQPKAIAKKPASKAKPSAKAAAKAPKAAKPVASKVQAKAAAKKTAKPVAKVAGKKVIAKVTAKPVAKAAPKKVLASRPAAPVAKKASPAKAPAPTKAKAGAKAPAKGSVAAAPKPAPVVPVPTAAPAVRTTKASARLAQLTVPSMAQSVASTAAKSSYTQTIAPVVLNPPPLVAVKKDPKLAHNWKTKPVEQLSDAEVLAMPDSEYMNEKQMAFFRLKLTQLKQEILNSAGETTEHLREDTVIVPDPADRATIEEEHALELRTRDRERKLLKKIEQSIGRIDAGDYGYCDETGEPIGVGRLLARPTATLSLEAQQRRELKQKMFGD